MKTYNIYDRPSNENSRFILGIEGDNSLFVLGLNPSTANRDKSDLTMTKIEKFAEQNGFDGFIMFNLYAQKSTSPKNVHEEIDAELHKKNIEKIVLTLSKKKNDIYILACWGESMRIRSYFLSALKDIFDSTKHLNIKWLKIGKNLTKSGHPRHPSRAAYDLRLKEFEIDKYLKSLTLPRDK